MKMNKKAMMDDFFDFIFTVIIASFCLIFIGFALQSGFQSAEKETNNLLGQYNLHSAGISNLRAEAFTGSFVNPEEVDSRLAKSKFVGGRTITSCTDYLDQDHCLSDIAGIWSTHPKIMCGWSENTGCSEKILKPGEIKNE